MRVALVSPGFPPTPGGVESAVAALAHALVRSGCEVQVWTAARQAGRTVEQVHGVTVVRVPSWGPSRYPLSPRLWWQTRRQAEAVDLLHVHGFHATAALGALACAVPYVFSPHYHGVGHTAGARLLHTAYAPAGRRLLDRAAAVITATAAERRLLLQHRPQLAERTSVVHHGVDGSRLSRAEPATGDPVLVVLGRLEPYKRVDHVIASFSRISNPGRLVIIGEGRDRARLERMAAAGGRGGDIAFLGHQPEADVARWLRAARGVVSMSEHEAFGLVALEGASAGASVLLSDIPAHREVLSLLEHRGRLVEPASLPEAMAQVLSRPRHPPAQLRSWDDVAAEHLLVYERAGAAHRTTTSS